MFLAVALVGGENGDAVYGRVTAKNIISSTMNAIIMLILHFPFFTYNRSVLGFIFDITSCYICPFLR